MQKGKTKYFAAESTEVARRTSDLTDIFRE
jgi:hypothetical protein